MNGIEITARPRPSKPGLSPSRVPRTPQCRRDCISRIVPDRRAVTDFRRIRDDRRVRCNPCKGRHSTLLDAPALPLLI
jgi:hypothetical protein